MVKLYDYSKLLSAKVVDILNIGTVNQQFVTLVTPSLEAGEYVIGYAWEGDFNGQKNQPFFTSLTGTFAGAEFSDSVGDNDTGIKTRYYAFPKNWAGGVMTVGMQGRKDPGFSANMDLNFIDVFVRRVGPAP